MKTTLPESVRIGMAILLCVFAMVATLDVAVLHHGFFFPDEEAHPYRWVRDVIVEANGLVFDTLLFGVLILYFDERREAARRATERKSARNEKIRGWHEQLQDYVGWQSDESAMRTAGLIRRLSREEARVEAPNAYMRRRELSELNLTRADLCSANLEECQLDGAKLHGAKLRFARLEHANLERCKLTGVDLFQAVMTGAILNGADLTDADLVEADLTGARLVSAILIRAILRRATLTGADLSGADLRGANLSDAVLERANLSGAVRLPEDDPIPGWVSSAVGAPKPNTEVLSRR